MPVEFKDYYKILGVSRTAPDEEIRKAFRRLARQYHPDVAKNKAEAEEKFKEINEAYEVLGDPAKRKKYDTLGADWNRARSQPPPGWQQGARFGKGSGEEFEFRFGGTGFSDFFEQFFGGRGGVGGFRFGEEEAPAGGGERTQRGGDIEGDILVTLTEALHGSVRSVSLQRVNPGTGSAETHTFRVKIPAGVEEGRLIRVAGKGEAGFRGTAPGDLYLRIRFAKHPDFRVRGSDLFYDLPLAPWEAILGATVTIPTLEGSISLKIPAGTSQGQQLRVRGRGLAAGGGNRGDLYAVASIQVPSQATPEEKALWEQLAAKSTFNPRGAA